MTQAWRGERWGKGWGRGRVLLDLGSLRDSGGLCHRTGADKQLPFASTGSQSNFLATSEVGTVVTPVLQMKGLSLREIL